MFSASSYSYYWVPALLALASPLLFQLLSSTSKKSQVLADTDTTPPTTTHARTHTVVIVGAGFTGVPLAHHLLKHTPASVGLRVVLVSPNDEFLWPYATVRAILPDGFGDEKIFFPLGPGFAKYGASQFEHVVGIAQSLDAETNRLTVSTSGDERLRTIDYDTLVIASGSTFKETMPFKNLTDTTATKAGIQILREKIAAARSIVVAGAGLTGVEVAGELGQEYGLAGTKEITLIAGDTLPLGPGARHDVRQIVARELAELKVKIVANTRVVGATTTPAGRQSLTLRTGDKNSEADTATTTLETDLYIPAFGVRPNTDFVPADMLDAAGRVKVDRSTLQATCHADVFALGDAGNAQTASGKHADAQVRYLAPALQDRLAGRAMPAYKADDTFVFAVTIGPFRGTGQVGSWRLWAWIIRKTIATHLGSDYAAEIAAGNRTLTQTKW